MCFQMRYLFIVVGILCFPFVLVAKDPERERFSIIEATIPQIQAALRDGRVTSRALVTQYLARIGMYENKINAAISVNSAALKYADQLDNERANGVNRGPLHGIPIAIKDNILTTDMPTTAGTLALDGFIAPYESTLTQNLRDAGAIIIAKTVLTEMANWMVLGMPNNYSAVGGYALNPYDPRRDPRPGRDDGRGVLPTGSSSSGSGTAANLWVANIGTETVNSVIGPSSATMLAAIKPTVGRISRWGIIPVSYDQDSAGPMTRTISDAAILLGVLEGKNPDPKDPMTLRCKPPSNNNYLQFLGSKVLSGKRIGVPRKWFVTPYILPGRTKASGGVPKDQQDVLNNAIAVLKGLGATVIEAADIPSAIAQDWEKNSLVRGSCTIGPSFKSSDKKCSVVLKYSFKRDFNVWLRTLGDSAPFESLSQLRQWNITNRARGTLKYEQHTLDISDEMDLESELELNRYKLDRARDILLSGEYGTDAVLKKYELDALLFLGSRGSRFLAKAGYPSITVPFSFVQNQSGDIHGYPINFEPKPAPLGVTFAGTACSEPELLAISYAFEQASMRRRPPTDFH